MNTEPIWKAWFAKHGGGLLLFARQQARCPDDAEDLVQEAFVRIWRLYGHTGEVSPSLVYRAIRRLAIDWARSLDSRKRREEKVSLDVSFVASFDRGLERCERRDALLQAVDRLPPEQKEVIDATCDTIVQALGQRTSYRDSTSQSPGSGGPKSR